MEKRIQIKKIKAEQTWELRRSVMWPEKDIDYVKLPEDHEGIHWGLFENEKLISIVSLFIKGNRAQFRKLATLQKEQGKGHGTSLLNHLIAFLSSLPLKTLWCNARTSKTDFYTRFGFSETNQPFLKDGREYIVMEKAL